MQNRPARLGNWRDVAFRACLACALFLSAGAALAIDPLPFKDRAEELRFQALAAELRCLQCQNQNLADSDSALAKDLRVLVFEQIQSGKSDAQIKQYLIDRYGNFVIYDPPINAETSVLWLAPVLGLAALVGALLWRAKRAARTPARATHTHEEDW